MAQSPLVTLAAGTIGAVIGLMAPIVNSSVTRLGARRQAQRDVADKVMELLGEPQPIDELLGGSSSAARRRLYILGIRLNDGAARKACLDLVAAAGETGASEDDLYPHWRQTLDEVSRVSRGKR
jgi:hypothetical protein